MSLMLAVDLEATCWENQIAPSGLRQSVDEMEIIEFGCVVTRRTGEVIDSRSFLVRPRINPELTPFCQQLTSISQDMVNDAPVFSDSVVEIDAWLSTWPEIESWVSWGNYDRNHIAAQSEREGCLPAFMKLPHFNLKKIWKNTTGERKRNGLGAALKYHGLEFNGHPHRGVDDARNIARLLPYMDWSLEGIAVTRPPV